MLHVTDERNQEAEPGALMGPLPSSRPVVSVIMPAYNASGVIGQAIDSVVRQTYRHYEIIVVNDGSPDTPQLEQVLTRYGGRVRYLRQKNQGPSAARNTAIRAALGEYVAFLDSDDEWLPDLLESQLELLHSQVPLDLVYADAVLFGESPLAGETVMQRYPSKGDVTLEAVLQNHCVVTTSTVVARKEILTEIGLFNEAYRCCEDFDLWLRLLHSGARFGYQTRVLARHREHAESITAASELLLETQVRVLREVRESLPLTTVQVGLLESRVRRCTALLGLHRGKQLILARDYEEARRAVAGANEFFRSWRLKIVGHALRIAPALVRLALTRSRARALARSLGS